MASTSGKIRIGIGGWTFAPWRGAFYPDDLAQKNELSFAAQKLSAIEINGTFYGSQKPASFKKWHDETPKDFVFSMKAPRFATNRKVLAEVEPSITRFMESGIAELKSKLGPINWQLAKTKKFEPDDFESFLKLLPNEVEGLKLRHVVEVRHDSFAVPEFVALLRKYGVAAVIAGDSEFVQIADPTADFVYLRIMGTKEEEPNGYSASVLDKWAERAKTYASGGVPEDLKSVGETPEDETPRDVFLYVISGDKVRNPLAAMELMKRV